MQLFGRKKSPTTTSAPSSGDTGVPAGTHAAIEKLRDAHETFEKRKQHMDRKIDEQVKLAKKYSAQGKKRDALQCIKRKKIYEKQLDQLMATMTTLETQAGALEQMNMTKVATSAMKAGAQTIAAETAAMGGIDEIDKLMDSVEDGLADANEIGDAMSRQIDHPGVDADEDDLAKELEDLMQEGLSDQLSSVDLGNAGASMPSAPVSMPAAPKGTPQTAEEKELAELEASMAM